MVELSAATVVGMLALIEGTQALILVRMITREGMERRFKKHRQIHHKNE